MPSWRSPTPPIGDRLPSFHLRPAQLLGVGIVTVQQAARVLEHEGLLAVRRGPGGGYYGTRPDDAALERGLAAYLRVHGFRQRESQEMLALLDCEIMPAAAHCTDEQLRAVMHALDARIETSGAQPGTTVSVIRAAADPSGATDAAM